MSSVKIQMKLLTNQNKLIKQSAIKESNNQNFSLKLGFNKNQRNYVALQIQGNKSCNSCNNKK